MDYKHITLKEDISVNKIYTVHYFEYMNDYSFVGESHDFWEFLYVDKGAVNVTADTSVYRLEKGDIIFHQPNEFHKVNADGKIAPNLVVLSFECNSPYMDFFKGKILKLDETECNLLASIISETKLSFLGRLDDPYLKEMPLAPEPPFASLQLIKLYLEHFLIHVLRRYCDNSDSLKNVRNTSKTTKKKNNEIIFTRICKYLETHLCEKLTIEQICKDNLIGRSQLQKIFQEKTGLGIIEYFSLMKIDAAKHMMRNNNLNFTQISEKLGYSSIHYFSRQFKKIANMTPSEYVSSIKALSDNH